MANWSFVLIRKKPKPQQLSIFDIGKFKTMGINDVD